MSTGKLERTFSQVNLIKCSKRSSLGHDFLNDLLTLNMDKVPLQEFSPEAAIDLWWDTKTRKPSHGYLWWDAKTRKPSHGPRKQYKKHTPHGQASDAPTSDTESEEGEEEAGDKLLLDDWMQQQDN